MRLNITMMITAMRQVRPQAFLQLSQVQALRVRVWRRLLRQVLLHLLLVQAFILPPQALRVWLWRRLLRKDLLLLQAILPPSEVGELWVWRRLLWQDLLVQALFPRVRRQVLRQVLWLLMSGIP